MLLMLLNYVVFRVFWKIDVHLISTLVNKVLLLFLLLLLLLLFTHACYIALTSMQCYTDYRKYIMYTKHVNSMS